MNHLRIGNSWRRNPFPSARVFHRHSREKASTNRMRDDLTCWAWLIVLLAGSIVTEPLLLHPGLYAQQAQGAPLDTSRLGLLDWGRYPVTGQAWTPADLSGLAKASSPSPVGKEVRNVLRSARYELDKTGAIVPIERIEMEGVLSTETRHQRSIQAVRIFPTMISWAFCARLQAGDSEVAGCKAALFEGLFGKDGNRDGWASTNPPATQSTNPICCLSSKPSISPERY